MAKTEREMLNPNFSVSLSVVLNCIDKYQKCQTAFCGFGHNTKCPTSIQSDFLMLDSTIVFCGLGLMTSFFFPYTSCHIPFEHLKGKVH